MLLFRYALLLVICVLINEIQQVHSDALAIASEHHRIGIDAAMRGQYEVSLAHLRAACRKLNSSAVFWSDLGVTEMRIGQYSKAKRRFMKALSIDDNYELAKANLFELQRFMSPEDFSEPVLDEINQQHTILPFPEISADELTSVSASSSPAAILDGYAKILSSPFVIRGALQHWGFNLSALTLQHLTRKYDLHKIRSSCDVSYRNTQKNSLTTTHILYLSITAVFT